MHVNRVRINGLVSVWAAITVLALVVPDRLAAGERFLVNHPNFPVVHANALDQPRLYGVLTRDGEVIPAGAVEGQPPAFFRAFIDTGSSGFVISHLHAADLAEDVPTFGFGEEDFIGHYTNLGLGGEEVGDVTRSFGVRLLNDPVPADDDIEIEDLIQSFIDYGEHSLWVRRKVGIGEQLSVNVDGFTIELPTSPINIIGMPVIERRAMVMDWVSVDLELEDLFSFSESGGDDAEVEMESLFDDVFEGLKEMQTRLLERNDPAVPATNITLELRMEEFVKTGDRDPGETLPSTSRNPLVKDVTISHDSDRDAVTGDWLFDTGAGATFIDFDYARTIGLVNPDEYGPEEFERYVEEHAANEGPVSEVGGIGDAVIRVPIMEVNEIRIPAREGFDVVWENTRIMLFDHPELAELGLRGIFGMNLIGPAVTLDAAALEQLFGGGMGSVDDFEGIVDIDLGFGGLLFLLEMLMDISPPAFSSIVFEVTGEETGELRLFTDRALPRAGETVSFESWRKQAFGDEAENDEVGGPTADPGGFGLPNMLRYALALDPHRPQRGGLPRVEWRSNPGSGGPVLGFTRFRYADGLEYLLEVSSNLRDWSEVEVEWVVVEIDGERERVEARFEDGSPPAPSAFYRIRVKQAD